MSRTNNINEDRYFGSGGGGGSSVNFLHLYVHLYVTPGEVSR